MSATISPRYKNYKNVRSLIFIVLAALCVVIGRYEAIQKCVYRFVFPDCFVPRKDDADRRNDDIRLSACNAQNQAACSIKVYRAWGPFRKKQEKKKRKTEDSHLFSSLLIFFSSYLNRIVISPTLE
jgi:hypothetical protein